MAKNTAAGGYSRGHYPISLPGRRAFFAVLMLWSGRALFADEAILLRKEQSAFMVGTRCAYLIDESRRLSIDDVSRGTAAARFIPHRTETMNFGYTGAAVWIRFRVRNVNPDQTWVLKADAFDDVRLYLPDAGAGYRELRTGLKAPPSDTIRRYGYYMIPLPALEGEASVYLRFAHEDTMNFHLAILNARGFMRENGEDIFLGFIFGVIAVMIVYNLLLFLGLKDSSYLYYSLYISNMFAAQMIFAGLCLDFFPAGSSVNSFTIETIVIALAIAFYIQFVRRFLMARVMSPVLDKVLFGLSLLAGVFVPSAFFLPYLVRTGSLYVLFSTTLCLHVVLMIRCVRQKYRPVRFYFFAWLILVVSVVFFVMRNFAVIPNFFLVEWGMHLGSGAEAVLLALGLAYRINLLRTEKNIAVEWGQSNLEKAERIEGDYRMLFETAPLGIALFTLDGKYLAVNESYCRMYERAREELLGKYFFNLVYPESRDNAERVYWDALVAGPRTGIATFERTNVTRTGRRIAVRYFLNFTSAPSDEPAGVLCCVEDITDLRAALDGLRASVREKELLLKEVHHRVKNNLQIIMSLFRLKSREIDDPRVQAVLEATAGRIRAISNVHNRIYLSRDVAQVDSETFIPASVKQALSVSRLKEDQYDVVYCIDQAKLSVDIALPLSLIINELITNAVTHGYDGRAALTIEVRFRAHSPDEENGRLLLEIEDSGRGFPENFPRAQFESFGLNLVETLASQIGGSLTLSSGPRACVAVVFGGGREQSA